MMSVLRAENASADMASDLAARYEWFSVARVLRAHLSGEADRFAGITASGRCVSSLNLAAVDAVRLATVVPHVASTDEIIDRFLEKGGRRIVAEEDSDLPAEDIRIEPELSEEEDLVSEELAEVYLSQGLYEEAKAIYRKLSLLNTEKSVYFAEIIDKIEKNN